MERILASETLLGLILSARKEERKVFKEKVRDCLADKDMLRLHALCTLQSETYNRKLADFFAYGSFVEGTDARLKRSQWAYRYAHRLSGQNAPRFGEVR